MPPKIRDVIARVEKAGWVLVRQVGSHRQFKHPTRAGTITIAGHPGEHLHPKTLKQVLRVIEEEQ
jgi:predicted RNA binding protein YcfA (HicA-like mRNA interferase family)